jgi:hypothetical protein
MHIQQGTITTPHFPDSLIIPIQDFSMPVAMPMPEISARFKSKKDVFTPPFRSLKIGDKSRNVAKAGPD